MMQEFQKSNLKRDREIYLLKKNDSKKSFREIAEIVSIKYPPKISGERARQQYIKYLKKIAK